jgi:hypothetical protein
MVQLHPSQNGTIDGAAGEFFDKNYTVWGIKTGCGEQRAGGAVFGAGRGVWRLGWGRQIG